MVQYRGKKNREMIERAEKRQRDHFRQKRKRNHKEIKEQGQCSILHNETNISMWFYIPKERLVLNSKRTPISIQITRIKHSMSRRCKLDLHFI